MERDCDVDFLKDIIYKLFRGILLERDEMRVVKKVIDAKGYAVSWVIL